MCQACGPCFSRVWVACFCFVPGTRSRTLRHLRALCSKRNAYRRPRTNPPPDQLPGGSLQSRWVALSCSFALCGLFVPRKCPSVCPSRARTHARFRLVSRKDRKAHKTHANKKCCIKNKRYPIVELAPLLRLQDGSNIIYIYITHMHTTITT